MEKTGKADKQHSLWYHAALLVPIVHSASMVSWTSVLLMIGVGLLGRCSKWAAGWVLLVQKCWSAVVVGTFLQWSSGYWVSLPFGTVAPLMLLVLVWWTVSVQGKAPRIGCVLLWPIAILLGAVLLSGISEVRWEYLKPNWKMTDLTLLALLLIPAKSAKGTSWLPAAGLSVSIVATGVLSVGVADAAASGIYELSRSLSLLGVAERFESLVAAAMTLGFYSASCYLLEEGNEESPVWGYVAIAALVYVLSVPIPGWVLAAGSTVAWLILPLLDRKK